MNIIASSLLLLPQQAPILGATWSLSHIVLFYLLFALYLWRPKLMKWVFVLQLIGIVALYAVIDPGPSRNLFSLVFSHYNVNFIAGALCAHIVMKYGSRFGGSFIALGVLGYALTGGFTTATARRSRWSSFICLHRSACCMALLLLRK